MPTRRFIVTSTEVWTLGIIALVLLYRFPDRVMAPQLWAEDGPIFLQQQLEQGIASIWTPYAGYLHVILRILALIIGYFTNLIYIPLAYTCVAFLGTLLTALFLLRCRIDTPYKPLFALTLVLVPHPSEVYLNLTNLQWILATALPFFFLQTPAPTRVGQIRDSVALFLMALTGPFAMLFSPLLVYRLWRDGWKSTGNIFLGSAGFIGIAIQAYFLVRAVPPPPAIMSPLTWLMMNGPILLSGLFLGKKLPHYILGENAAHRLMSLLQTTPAALLYFLIGVVALGILLGVIVLVVGISRLPTPRRALGYALLFCTTALFLSLMRRTLSEPLPIGPFSGGSRYCFLPYVFITWTVLLLGSAGGAHRYFGRFLFLLILLATTSVLGLPPDSKRIPWTAYIRRYQQGKTSMTIPIPSGEMIWQLHLPPPRSH